MCCIKSRSSLSVKPIMSELAYAFPGSKRSSGKKGFRDGLAGRHRARSFLVETRGDAAFETAADFFVGKTQDDVAVGIGSGACKIAGGVQQAQKFLRGMIPIEFGKR